MALVLAILVFVTIALAIFAFLAAIYSPTSVLGSRLRSLGSQRSNLQKGKPAIKERFEQALDPLSKALPMSPTEVSRARAWLIQAGYRESRHLTLYLGARVFMALLALGAVLVVSGVNSPLLLIGAPALGFLLPRFMLKRMIRDRQMRIRLGLPDALDLAVICVEAGLALDQAMMRVGADLKHAHPDLSDEFHLVNLEMRAGKPRAEALHNLVTRTGVDDIKSLVGTLVQTDRFGTSVTQALRVHSDSLRTERRQRAEEQAAKTTIKMVPPLVIFVLPSIIVVTLGPAIISLYRTLTAASH
ncbi:MAG TPA: type II secretion system F family protein [Terriglobales bacterium]|nr:type II secretion system F family protein [Terriglobales bacterium]